MNKKHWLIDISLIVIIAVMGVFVYLELNRTFDFMRQRSSSTQSIGTDTLIEVDEAASSLEVVVNNSSQEAGEELRWLSLEGELLSLSDFEGKPLLVNFWATWCPPCLAEMPLIQDYADQYQDQLVVLAINAGEEEAVVRDFVTRHNLELTFLLDPTNSAAKHFRVYGFPTSLFFDENGVLQSTHIGELNETLIANYLLKIGIGE
ncbi:MAG: TlpA family protein disulfide reductase [Brevefilum sp.]|nr:TlpA family protein disulfide reductase [Brevefilum sp.]